jgi:hypothetical protein
MARIAKLAFSFCAVLVWGGVVVKAQTALSPLSDLPSEPQVSASVQLDTTIAETSATADTPTWNPPGSSSGNKPFLHRVVAPGLGPQDLTVPEKFEMSFRSRVSFGAFGSSLFGAGERQLFNSRPHYGTDSGAFGERLGAAELKQFSESFFSYGLYASLFRSDPHYYVMGPGHPLLHRAIYSASRVLLTRTDSGGTNVNWAKLAGMASATALTNTYYPVPDRGVRQSLSAYGSSLATSALTLELHEFVPNIFAMFKHKNKRAAQTSNSGNSPTDD